MSQSKLGSIIESIANTFSAYVLSYLVWMWVVPLFTSVRTTASEGLVVVLIFTILSLIRNYFWRRIFNKSFWRF